VEEGILTYEERPGKGGHHRVYYPNMDREEFSTYVITSINEKLSAVFPKAVAIKTQ